MKCLKWFLFLCLFVYANLLSAQFGFPLSDPYQDMELKKEWTDHPAYQEFKAAFDKFRQAMGGIDHAAFEEMSIKMVKENPNGPPSEQKMIEEITKIKGGKEFLEAMALVREKQKKVAEQLPDFVAYQKEFFQKKAKGDH